MCVKAEQRRVPPGCSCSCWVGATQAGAAGWVWGSREPGMGRWATPYAVGQGEGWDTGRAACLGAGQGSSKGCMAGSAVQQTRNNQMWPGCRDCTLPCSCSFWCRQDPTCLPAHPESLFPHRVLGRDSTQGHLQLGRPMLRHHPHT